MHMYAETGLRARACERHRLNVEHRNLVDALSYHHTWYIVYIVCSQPGGVHVVAERGINPSSYPT